MPWFSGIVLFLFLWFLTFLMVLPVRLQSQRDAGQVTPGTPASAPANPQMKRRLVITTVIATLWFLVVAWIITSGALTVEDIDVVNRWVNG